MTEWMDRDALIQSLLAGKFVVIRIPTLSEDEGHCIMYDAFDRRGQAEAWIANQQGRFFGANCYVILP